MFVSYMDEAGHFRNPNSFYVGMAGFIAPEEIWGPFGKWWRGITRGPVPSETALPHDGLRSPKRRIRGMGDKKR
jgi:hypothetical protein